MGAGEVLLPWLKRLTSNLPHTQGKREFSGISSYKDTNSIIRTPPHALIYT